MQGFTRIRIGFASDAPRGGWAYVKTLFAYVFYGGRARAQNLIFEGADLRCQSNGFAYVSISFQKVFMMSTCMHLDILAKSLRSSLRFFRGVLRGHLRFHTSQL